MRVGVRGTGWKRRARAEWKLCLASPFARGWLRIFTSQMERAFSAIGQVARWLSRSKLCCPNFIRCSTQRNNVKNRVCVRYLVLLTVSKQAISISKLSRGSGGMGWWRENGKDSLHSRLINLNIFLFRPSATAPREVWERSGINVKWNLPRSLSDNKTKQAGY